jgi:PKD repeat protein
MRRPAVILLVSVLGVALAGVSLPGPGSWDLGAAADARALVGVARPTQEPIARFTFTPSAPQVGQAVAFDGSSSSADVGSVVSWGWAFGDGTTGSGVVATHAYAAPGSYEVTLTVTDSRGRTGTFAQNVSVSLPVNQPPTASFLVSPNPAQVNQAVTVNALASLDPDGTLSSYTWTFGDGTTLVSATPVLEHVYAASGTYEVKLRVTDDRGGTDTKAGVVTISAAPLPAAQPPGAAPAPVQSAAAPTSSVTAGRLAPAISPFPIVRIRGRITARGVVVQLLVVQAPNGVRVLAYCAGRACPRIPTQRAIVRHRRVRLRSFEREIRAGARLVIYVTQKGRTGKYTRFTIRRGTPPARKDLCATGRRAIKCPTT